MEPRITLITLGVADLGRCATLVKAGQKVFWGGYSGYFSDPDGFLWEVAWNPHFTVA